MAATARMILQVDPAEKARWTAEARKAGISTSEFVRLAASSYDPDAATSEEETAVLRELVPELYAAADRMTANFAAMIADLRELNDPERAKLAKAKVMAELEASNERLDLRTLEGMSA